MTEPLQRRAPRASGERSGAARRERALLGVLLAALVLPLWLVHHVPFQDAPVHVENAEILRRWLFEDAPDLHAHYVLHEQVASGALAHWLLAGLLALVPRGVALKLFLSACVVLLPLGVRSAARALRTGGEWAAWLVLPLVWNQLLQLGFLPFTLGLGVLFFFIGAWLEFERRPTVRGCLWLALLGMTLALAHVACAACGLVVVATLLLWHGVLDWRAGVSLTRALRRDVETAVVLSPAALLTAYEVTESRFGGSATGDSQSLLGSLRSAASLQALVSHGSVEKTLALGVVLLFAGALVVSIRSRFARPAAVTSDGRASIKRSGLADGLLLPVVGFVLAAVAARDARSLAYFTPLRWILVAYLLAALWLAGQPLPALARRGLRALAAGLAAGLLVAHTVALRELDGFADEYVSVASALEPGRTLLPLTFAPNGRDARGARLSSHDAAFLHLSAEVATEARAIDLTNDFYSVALRREVDPGKRIRGPRQLEACARWLEDGGAPDYVLVWEASDEDRRSAVFRELETRYERTFVSGRGLMELYRRRAGR